MNESTKYERARLAHRDAVDAMIEAEIRHKRAAAATMRANATLHEVSAEQDAACHELRRAKEKVEDACRALGQAGIEAATGGDPVEIKPPTFN